MLALVLVLLAQVPCGPFDLTVVCNCKQGVATACEALRTTSPELAKQLETAAQAAGVAVGIEQTNEALRAEGESSPASPEPPECKGQLHHIISKPIARALSRHPTLRGHYKARDPRFITRAVDEKAHCGYQE